MNIWSAHLIVWKFLVWISFLLYLGRFSQVFFSRYEINQMSVQRSHKDCHYIREVRKSRSRWCMPLPFQYVVLWLWRRGVIKNIFFESLSIWNNSYDQSKKFHVKKYCQLQSLLSFEVHLCSPEGRRERKVLIRKLLSTTAVSFSWFNLKKFHQHINMKSTIWFMLFGIFFFFGQDCLYWFCRLSIYLINSFISHNW